MSYDGKRALALIFAALLAASPAFAQSITTQANSVFRDYNTPGQALSGVYNPPKADVRALFGAVASRVGISPEDYGATGNGTTDDTAAVVAAVLAGGGATGKPVVLTRNYRIRSTQSFETPLIFQPGASITVDAGVTVTLSGAISASDVLQIFKGTGSVVVSGAPRVSVAWWGATPGSADSAPAFNAAACDNCEIVVPPSTTAYTFCSVTPQAYSVFLPSAVLIQNHHDFKITAYGATFQMCGTAGACPVTGVNTGGYCTWSSQFLIDRSQRFEIVGGTSLGNRTGIASNIENGAVTFASVVDGRWADWHVSGNWGGSGAASYGDWFYNFEVRNIRMDAVGLCLDYAYAIHMTVDRVIAVGADANGEQDYTTKGGSKCLSLVVDFPMKDENHTGFGYTDSYDVTYKNSDVSGFNVGAQFSSGSQIYSIDNAYHDNAGYGSNGGVGLQLNYIAGTYSSGNASGSAGFPVNHVTSIGDRFVNNGLHSAAAGFLITNSTITNSDALDSINVIGPVFDGNGGNAIEADAASHLTNVNISGAIYKAGTGGQPLAPGSNLRTVMGTANPATLNSCAGGTIASGSTRFSGSFVPNNAGCTVLFPTAFAISPACIVVPGNAGVTLNFAASTSQLSVSSVSSTSATLYYQCSGQ